MAGGWREATLHNDGSRTRTQATTWEGDGALGWDTLLP